MTVNKESVGKSLQILKSPGWSWISDIKWPVLVTIPHLQWWVTVQLWHKQTNFHRLKKKTSHHSRDVSYSLRRGRREEERQKESCFFFHTVANTLFVSEFQRKTSVPSTFLSPLSSCSYLNFLALSQHNVELLSTRVKGKGCDCTSIHHIW